MNIESAARSWPTPISPKVERMSNEAALWAAVDSGVFAALQSLQTLPGGRAVQAVYTAILRRYPNITRGKEGMAADSGWSAASVKRAIQLLKKGGLITVRRRGPGQTAVIQLADLRDRDVVKGCLAKIRSVARVGNRKPRRLTSDPSRKVTSDPSRKVTSDPIEGSQVTHKASREHQRQQQGIAQRHATSEPMAQPHDQESAAAADLVKEKRAELLMAGVGEPNLTRLAKLPRLQPDTIRRLARRVGKGPGLLVVDAIAAVEADKKRRERAKVRVAAEAKKAEADCRKREAEAAERARVEAEQTAISRFVATVDDDTLEAARLAVLADLLPTSRRVLQGLDARASRTLKQQIYARLTNPPDKAVGKPRAEAAMIGGAA